MNQHRSFVAAGLILLTGCLVKPQPAPLAPAPPPDSIATTEIAAPPEETWRAVVAVFADRDIPIPQVQRANGAIAAAMFSVPGRSGAGWAECGTSLGLIVPPDRATYHVLVGGKGATSTTTVLVRFTAKPRSPEETRRECTTKGVWERELASDIRARAEASRTALR